MHKSIQNLIDVQKLINSKLVDLKNNKIPKIIAVSKTFNIDKILPLIEYGHLDYGENKVQETIDKWSDIKSKNQNIKLHLIGKLQTNKVKQAITIFDYIHSLDNQKLAKKIADEEKKQLKKIKLFIQVNIGSEPQKSGVNIENLDDLYKFSTSLNLDIIGLMCIPPASEDPQVYFQKLKALNDKLGLKELSMGMSSDYMVAIKNHATFVRVGSKIFGERI